MNEAMERQAYMQSLTKRLVIFTMATLFFLGVSLYFFIDTAVKQDKSFLVIMVFMCGLLGGFVSIQQRLPKITLDEMKVLSSSWVSITLIPINGGIFALILMLMFVGQIVQGDKQRRRIGRRIQRNSAEQPERHHKSTVAFLSDPKSR